MWKLYPLTELTNRIEKFQKNLVVWKLLSNMFFFSPFYSVSEELSSVETVLSYHNTHDSYYVSEELSSVETRI